MKEKAGVPSWLVASSENDLVFKRLILQQLIWIVSSSALQLTQFSVCHLCLWKRWIIYIVFYFFPQCHTASLSGWATEELCGHAGTDAGRKRFFGHRVPVREGVVKTLPFSHQSCFLYNQHFQMFFHPQSLPFAVSTELCIFVINY